jgi:hypothetical protein
LEILMVQEEVLSDIMRDNTTHISGD